MSDLLEISKTVAPFWKLIVSFFVVAGVQWAFWKANKDFSRIIQHTASGGQSAPYDEVALTQIMIATNATQNLLIVLIGVVTTSMLFL
jgi:hypothetical protein